MSEGVRKKVGNAWGVFAVMDGDKFVTLVAKNPYRRYMIDITEDLRGMLAGRGEKVSGEEAGRGKER